MRFSGSLVAIVTPMHPDGSLDLPGLRKLVDWHVESGTSAIVITPMWPNTAAAVAENWAY